MKKYRENIIALMLCLAMLFSFCSAALADDEFSFELGEIPEAADETTGGQQEQSIVIGGEETELPEPPSEQPAEPMEPEAEPEPVAPEKEAKAAPIGIFTDVYEGQGFIGGTTTDMEYSADGGMTYIPCGDTATPAKMGEYLVRYKETETTYASEPVKVGVIVTAPPENVMDDGSDEEEKKIEEEKKTEEEKKNEEAEEAKNARYGLWISGAEVTSEASYGVNWSFDVSSFTLTLKGGEITATGIADGIAGIVYDGVKDLKIMVSGETKINAPAEAGKCNYYGIYNKSENKLTIAGSGKLTIAAGETDAEKAVSYGIFSNGELVISEGAEVEAAAGKGNNASIGVYTSKNLTVNGALSARSGETKDKEEKENYKPQQLSVAVQAAHLKVSGQNAALKAVSEAALSNSAGINVPGIIESEGKIEAKGSLWGISAGAFSVSGGETAAEGCYGVQAAVTVSGNAKISAAGSAQAFTTIPEFASDYVPGIFLNGNPADVASCISAGTVSVSKGTETQNGSDFAFTNENNVAEEKEENGYISEAVTPKTVESISCYAGRAEINVGETEKIYVQITPGDAGNKAFSVFSPDNGTLISGAEGTYDGGEFSLTGLSGGTATVTVKSVDNAFAEQSFTIGIKDTTISVTSIKFYDSEWNETSEAGITEGGELTLCAWADDAATDRSLTFESSDLSVASVSAADAGGAYFVTIHANGAGTAEIIARAEDGSGVTAVCRVIVDNEGTVSTAYSNAADSEGNEKDIPGEVQKEFSFELPEETTDDDRIKHSEEINEGSSEDSDFVPVTKINIIGETSISAYTEETIPLTATVEPENATKKDIAWYPIGTTSTNATIDTATGIINTGTIPGEFQVYARSENGADGNPVASDVITITIDEDSSEKYPLFIGGKQVTDRGSSGTGWFYDPTLNTLKLNGNIEAALVTGIEEPVVAGIYYSGDKNFTIEISQTSYITAPADAQEADCCGICILSSAKTLIAGDGVLYIAPGSTGDSINLWNKGIECHGDLRITDGTTVTITGNNSCNSVGIYMPDASTTLTLDGNVNVSAGTNESDSLISAGIIASRIVITDASANVTVKSSKADQSMAISVSELDIKAGMLSAIAGEGGEASTGIDARIIKINGGDVTAKSADAAAESNGIHASSVINISGGKVTAIADSAKALKSFGINNFDVNGQLNISGGTVTSYAGIASDQSYGTLGYQLNLSGGEFSTYGNKSNSLTAGSFFTETNIAGGTLNSNGYNGNLNSNINVGLYGGSVTQSGGKLNGVAEGDCGIGILIDDDSDLRLSDKAVVKAQGKDKAFEKMPIFEAGRYFPIVTADNKKISEEETSKAETYTGKKLVEISSAIRVTKITIPAAETVVAGGTVPLTAKVEPADATNPNIRWAVYGDASDAGKIDPDTGIVTAGETPGTSFQVAAYSTDGGNVASNIATITITDKPPIPVSEITVSPVEITLKIGETAEISAAVLPNEATNKAVSWTSSDGSVAAVIGDGEQKAVITAKNSGKVTVSASATDGSGISSKQGCVVTVTDYTYQTIPQNYEASWSRDIGGDVSVRIDAPMDQFDETERTAKIVDPVELPIAKEDYTISVASNTFTLKESFFNKQNMLFPSGKYTINLYFKNREQPVSFKLTVSDKSVAVESVAIEPASTEISVGEKATLTAILQPVNASCESITWKSSNTSIVPDPIPDSDNTKVATVQGTSPGTATITVTVKSKDGTEKTAECAVKVKGPNTEVSEINFYDSNTWAKITSATIPTDTGTITVAAWADDEATDKRLEFKSDNEIVATIEKAEERNGAYLLTIKAHKEGTANIIATAEDGSGVTEKCAITVKKQGAYPTKLLVSKDGKNYSKELNLRLENTGSKGAVYIKFEPSAVTVRNITATCDKKIVSVASSGSSIIIQAIGSGTDTDVIFKTKAEGDGASDYTGPTAIVHVSIGPFEYSYDPIPEDAEITWNGKTGGDATAEFDAPYNQFVKAYMDGTEIASTSYVISEGSTIITLKEAYLRTLASGNHTLKLTYESGKESTIPVHISGTDIALTNIAAEPEKSSIMVGETTDVTVSFTPSNATDKRYTVTSSKPTVVSVPSGTLSAGSFEIEGLKEGTAVITVESVADSDIKATFNITVTKKVIYPEAMFVSEDGEEYYDEIELYLDAKGDKGKVYLTFDPEETTVKNINAEYDKDLVSVTQPSGKSYLEITAKSSDVETEVIFKSKAEGDGTGEYTGPSATVYVMVGSATDVEEIIIYDAAGNETNYETINYGGTVSLYALVLPESASADDVHWSSSDSTIASVTPADGDYNAAVVTGRSAGTAKITATATDGSGVKADCYVTVSGGSAGTYTITYKDNSGMWYYDYPTNYTVKVNGPYSGFYAIAMDGQVVNSSYYNASSDTSTGGTTIVISKALLQSLSHGTHTLSVYYNNGQNKASTYIYIQSVKDPPKTGDPGWGALIPVFTFSMMGMAGCAAILNKNRKKKENR